MLRLVFQSESKVGGDNTGQNTNFTQRFYTDLAAKLASIFVTILVVGCSSFNKIMASNSALVNMPSGRGDIHNVLYRLILNINDLHFISTSHSHCRAVHSLLLGVWVITFVIPITKKAITKIKFDNRSI
ncbi:hypothetical protein ACTFIV_003179 [Dictyostelium citrinum]